MDRRESLYVGLPWHIGLHLHSAPTRTYGFIQSHHLLNDTCAVVNVLRVETLTSTEWT